MAPPSPAPSPPQGGGGGKNRCSPHVHSLILRQCTPALSPLGEREKTAAPLPKSGSPSFHEIRMSEAVSSLQAHNLRGGSGGGFTRTLLHRSRYSVDCGCRNSW